MKCCYKCHSDKPLSDFYKDKSRKDGVSTKCKDCARSYKNVGSSSVKTAKKCSRCKKTLPVSSFSKNTKRADGYQSQCKSCRSASRNVSTVEERGRSLMRRYGLTYPDYEKLLERQANRCGCCGEVFGTTNRTRPVVDHDHVTGRVRGLLCGNCNTGIGMLGDTPTGLLNALRYLNQTIR